MFKHLDYLKEEVDLEAEMIEGPVSIGSLLVKCILQLLR